MTGTDPHGEGLPPAATGRNRHPEDPPARCSVCGEPYDAVSDHTGGLMVALAENERFDRVCFEPILDEAGDDAGVVGEDGDTTAAGATTAAGDTTAADDTDGDKTAATGDPQPLIRFFHH